MPVGENENTAEKAETTDDGASYAKKRRKYSLAERIGRRAAYDGLWLMRRMRQLKRRILGILRLILRMLGYAFEKVKYLFIAFAVRNGLDHTKTVKFLRRLGIESMRAKKNGRGAQIKFFLGYFFKAIAHLIKRFISSPSHVMPTLALVLFCGVVKSTLDSTYALEVVYSGSVIGYIENESIFENAEINMRSRIAYEDYIKPADAIPKYSIVKVNEEQLMDVNELTDELIKASGNELGEATGLYVDDEFLGAVYDKSSLLKMLDSLLAPYRTDDENETVEFVRDVRTIDGLYPLTSITSIMNLHEKATSMQQEEAVYTTVEGDAPILIAQKTGVSLSTLLAMNPGIDKSLLIGQEVVVQQSVPFLEVQVKRTEVYEEEVAFKIERTVDSNQYEGYVKTTQVGKNGINEVTAEVTYLNGIETQRKIIDTVKISDPVNEKVTVGGKSVAEVGAQNTSTGFIWPTGSGYVSCLINGYYGHTGMDIASPAGTPIYASASGIVTKVAYNTTGYGYHIKISHGGNVETLYAHCSALYVKVGQWVSQGDRIAAMGRTGNATGNHLHFEIRSNGKYLDPAKYIGTRCPY